LRNKYPVVGDGSGFSQTDQFYREELQPIAATPVVRFFLLAVGMILVNAWVFLRWEFARLLAPGLRRVDEARLRFHRFTRLLIRAIEAIYDVVMAIPASQSPQSVIY
jgi:hypothetical protein